MWQRVASVRHIKLQKTRKTSHFGTLKGLGQPLTCTTPADLRRLRLPDDLGEWNRAILSFVLALPPDARVILYWC